MIRSLIVLTLLISAGCQAVDRPVIQIKDKIVTATCKAPVFRDDEQTPLGLDEITHFNFYYGRVDDLGAASKLSTTSNACSMVLPISESGVYQTWVTAVAGKESQPSEELQFPFDNPSPPGVVTGLAAEVN